MKRMRVFAGPNGSGKSTMVNQVIENGREQFERELINPNRHINPDDLNSIDMLDFSKFGLTVDENDFLNFMSHSSLYKRSNINIGDITINNNCLNMPNRNSYFGSMLADYLRNCYINSEEKLFSFETVFSYRPKLDILKSAKDGGWQVYLYFVSTADSCINCDRVKDRVLKGGHDVPRDKIESRYPLSLKNLFPALEYCRRAYIFDNSIQMKLIAEKKPDNSLILHENSIPAWFDEYVLSEIK